LILISSGKKFDPKDILIHADMAGGGIHAGKAKNGMGVDLDDLMEKFGVWSCYLEKKLHTRRNILYERSH
jgi:hypothetical protein